MNRSTLLRQLQEIGLGERESLVYLAALELGPTTPLRLASMSGVKRATVYNVLESLKAKGLIAVRLENGKKKFAAEPSSALETLLETKRALIQRILPDLDALQKLDSGGSAIRYFEGPDAAKSVYNGLLQEIRPGEDYLVISHQPGWYNLDPVFYQEFLERRAKLQIRVRVLTTRTELGIQHAKDKRLRIEAKFLPETSTLSGNLVILPRKLVMHQLASPVVVLVIENSSLIQFHRELFEVLWAGLPPVR